MTDEQIREFLLSTFRAIMLDPAVRDLQNELLWRLIALGETDATIDKERIDQAVREALARLPNKESASG